jgi:hypothetical protein
VRDCTKSLGVVAVEDEPRHLVRFVWYYRLVQELAQRNVRKRHLRRDPLGGRSRCDAGEAIATAQRRRLGQHIGEAREDEPLAAKRGCVHVYNSNPEKTSRRARSSIWLRRWRLSAVDSGRFGY